MNNIFITKIHINKLRHLQNQTIELHPTEPQPLLLTGKNGSGKTSLLLEIDRCLMNAKMRSFEGQRIELAKVISYVENVERVFKTPQEQAVAKRNFEAQINQLKSFMNIDIYINNDEKWTDAIAKNSLLLKTFAARRTTNLQKPTGISKINLDETQLSNSNFDANKVFIQHILNLKASRSFARDKNEVVKMQQIDAWFLRFEMMLKDVFDDETLVLDFDFENFNFLLKTKNREPFDFNTLSDGYAALLHIVTEIIIRMESKNLLHYDLEGIVLIDEIETHLHIDLQKKVLPFLMAFFPKIQFIITTHSPFVLTSINNGIVYDLEKQLRIEDMSGYSVEGVIEGYYDNDKYSMVLKKQIAEYETLLNKPIWSDEDSDQITEMRFYFQNLPKFLAPELEVQLQQLERLRRESLFLQKNT